MAKVVITIEDSPNGKVKIISEPSTETIIRMHISGNKLTAAHGYAFHALNAVLNESKRRNPNLILKLPKLGKA